MESGTAARLRLPLPYSLLSPQQPRWATTSQCPTTGPRKNRARASHATPRTALLEVRPISSRRASSRWWVFSSGVFFGLLAFRVTLGGAFAVFTAGFIAFAIGIAPGFEGIKISSVTSPAHIVEHLSSCSGVTHVTYSYEYSRDQGAEADRLSGPIKNPVSCFTHACDTYPEQSSSGSDAVIWGEALRPGISG